MIALDTETTGLDIWHGCRPFFVSACTHRGNLHWWEWDVDPITRCPIVPKKDIRNIDRFIKGDFLLFHNAKFDGRALESVGLPEIDWDRTHDTLIASHVLLSSESHKLKDLALVHLDIDDDDQRELQEATNEARRVGRRLGWRIAEAEDSHFPAMKRAPKAGWWVLDTWLPRAVAKAEGYKKNHPWWSVLKRYGLRDAERTMGLWLVFKDGMQEEGLMDVYEERRKLLGVTYRMEQVGVPMSLKRLQQARLEFGLQAERSEGLCYRLAEGTIDNIRSLKQLQGVLYGHFELQPIKETKTGWSTDADTLRALEADTPRRSKAFHFIRNLVKARKTAKAGEYLDAYKAAGMHQLMDWMILHPNFNITGTATTRFSSHDPNAQNISKQEAFNLRQVFGPMPGREWFALDYSNIEKRIPAYLAEEQELIDLFESGGSYHLLIGELLRPKMFQALGPKRFKKTEEYRWIKNGNFAEQYGAGKRTTDATFRVPGAYDKIKNRFNRITDLADSILKGGYQSGYVTTLGGYRLQCPREPTKPFNYFIQGSAGWAIILAMNRIDAYLQTLGDEYKIIMTIHDELVFDFPKRKTNIRKVKVIKELMEQSGEDLGLPTPVEVDRIRTNWAEGESILVA